MQRIGKSIRDWYVGPFVPGESVNGWLIPGRHRPHWTARTARRLLAFWNLHWKWLITTALAVGALAVSLWRS
jgi:hypothetical protein